MIQSLLVIDDDYVFASLVKFVLEHDTNWKILTASDGKEGLTLAKLYQPSVILLDIVLPSLNGLETYYLLKSDHSTASIPIIFVTAMVRMEKLIKAKIDDDLEVITKPFNMMTLEHQVINTCDRYLTKNN